MKHQAGLENRRSGDVTEGSNPSLSANFRAFSGNFAGRTARRSRPVLPGAMARESAQ